MGKRLPILLFTTITICLFSFLVTSCKDEEETSPTMSGDFNFTMDRYAFKGTEVNLSVPEVTDPTEGVEYYWTFGWNTDTIAGRQLQFEVPDSLGDFAVRAWGKKEGYQYRIAGPHIITSIDSTFQGSIKGRQASDNVFRDPRDGKKYFYKKIGNLDWFVQNLDWDGAGESYMKLDALSSLFGRLYSWNDATGGETASGLGFGPQGACPEGWSVPTKEDWEDLATVLNAGVPIPFEDRWRGLGEMLTLKATFNWSTNLWDFSPDNHLKNTVGWNALPAGNSTVNYSIFSGLFQYAFFWSSTESNEDQALYRFIYSENGDFSYNQVDKDAFGASVRCVRLSN